ncbi:MAG: hypothetical protein MZW92_58355 [Comamonadaceae bacterium]|nr:hypothetical protein [Comamonadaceae bacterium]
MERVVQEKRRPNLQPDREAFAVGAGRASRNPPRIPRHTIYIDQSTVEEMLASVRPSVARKN